MELLSWDNLWPEYGAHRTPLGSPLLVMDFTHRERQSFLCLPTTVLDLLASLKDQKLWKQVRSTSACTTNWSLFSGCRRISHRLVAIPARYVRAIVPFFVCTKIHYRSPSLDKAQEQCLYPIITSTKIFQLLPELL